MVTPKAEGELVLKADRFKQTATQSKKQLQDIGTQGTKSMNAVDKGSDKAAAGMSNLGRETGQASDKMDEFGDETDRAMKKAESGVSSADVGMVGLTASVIGLAQAVGGLVDAVFSFEEKAVALEKSMFGLEETTRDALRAQEDLITAMNDGTLKGRELARAVEDVDFLYRKLAIETKEVAAEEQALNGEYANFALNIGSTVIFSLTSIISLKAVLTASSATQAATEKLATTATDDNTRATGTNAGVTAGAAGSTGVLAAAKGVLTGAIGAATTAMRAFTISMLASPLAPVAIAAITAGTAFVAYETNLLGARDAMEDLAGAERGSLPTLTHGMLDLSFQTEEASDSIVDSTTQMSTWKAIADGMGITVEELMGQIQGAGNAAETTGGQIQTMGTKLKGLQSGFSSVSEAVYQAGQQLQGLGLQDVANQMQLLTNFALDFKEKGIDPLSVEAKLMQQTLSTSFESVFESAENAFGIDATVKWAQNMVNMGTVSQETLDKVVEKWQKVQDAANKAGEASEEALKKNHDLEKSLTNPLFGKNGIFTIDEDGNLVQTLGVNFGIGLDVKGSPFKQQRGRLGRQGRPRDRNPRGRMDKLGERLRQSFYGDAFGKGGLLQRPVTGVFGGMTYYEVAQIAGIPLPNFHGIRFGNNDPRGSDARTKAIKDDFRNSMKPFLRAVQERLHFASEFVELTGEGTLVDALGMSKGALEARVAAINKEIREGLETLGLDTFQQGRTAFIKNRVDFRGNIAFNKRQGLTGITTISHKESFGDRFSSLVLLRKDIKKAIDEDDPDDFSKTEELHQYLI